MINWYEVRCCCTPRKVFGWYPLPVGTKHFRVAPQPVPRTAWRPEAVPPRSPESPAVEFTVRDVHVGHPFGPDSVPEIRRAIYSDDHPIEFWRRVPGFVEAPPI